MLKTGKDLAVLDGKAVLKKLLPRGGQREPL
jgi:hypothetical protein